MKKKTAPKKGVKTKYICRGCLTTFYPTALMTAFKTIPKCPCCGTSNNVKKARL